MMMTEKKLIRHPEPGRRAPRQVLDGLVQVFFWVALALTVALTAALMMLVAAVTGTFLRFAHQDIASKLLFLHIRREGLWRGLYSLVRIAWASRSGFFGRGSFDNWMTALMVVMIPASGYLAASFLPTAVSALLLPQDYSSGFLDDVLTRTSYVDGAIGGILVTYVWLRGISYTARPPMTLPSGLSHASRDRLMINIYWYSQLKTATIFSSLYPWLFLFVTSDSVNSSSSAGHPTWPKNYPTC